LTWKVRSRVGKGFGLSGEELPAAADVPPGDDLLAASMLRPTEELNKVPLSTDRNFGVRPNAVVLQLFSQ